MKYFIDDFDSDCLILTEFIKDIEFNHNRRRKKINNNKNRGVKTFSMLYGVTPYKILTKNRFRERDPKSNYFLTIGRTQYPELQNIFEEFQSLYFSDFNFKCVQINKNLQCSEHKDGLNVGISIMVGLGDYRGGLLGIRDENGKVKNNETWHKLIKFNGSKFSHYTTPFTGERYTLVFFNPEWSVKKKKNLVRQ